VLCSAVVHPKLSLKDDGSGIFVEKLFVDWEMVVGLYNEIMTFTYGKKKNETTPLAREKIIELDFMSKRYGVLPSEFLKNSADEFQFNLFVASCGSDEEMKQAQKAQKRSRMNRGR